ncbi:MAG: hypothetical protein KDB82_06090 [Planctomycetes bacterium]|nr:hypothetical protein [Planctomycetota bacterium]
MRHLTACLLLALCAAPLMADIGPKPRTTGPGMVPQTDMKDVDIEMTSEEVELVLSKTDEDDTLDVTVTFHMTNLGEAASFEIGFPMGAFQNMSDFSVTTDGVERDPKIIDKNPEPEEHKDDNDGKKGFSRDPWRHDYWWVWDESWAEGAAVTHVVKYKLSVWHWSNYRSTGYILHTGAAWKNKIKSAKVTLSFGGDMELGYIERLGPAGFEIKGKKAVWNFKDLEPTNADDISIHYDRDETVTQKDARLVKESAKWWSSRVELLNLRLTAPKRFGSTEYKPEEWAAIRDALAALISDAKADGNKLVMPEEEPEKISWGGDIPEEVRKAIEEKMGKTKCDYARKGEAHKLLDPFKNVLELVRANPDDEAGNKLLRDWDNLVAKCLDGKLYAGATKLVVDDKRAADLKLLRNEAAGLLKPQVEEQPAD